MTCFACESFTKNPLTGAYKAGCRECSARSIAASPAYQERPKDAPIEGKYRAALERAFHGDWKSGHELVKQFAERRDIETLGRIEQQREQAFDVPGIAVGDP